MSHRSCLWFILPSLVAMQLFIALPIGAQASNDARADRLHPPWGTRSVIEAGGPGSYRSSPSSGRSSRI